MTSSEQLLTSTQAGAELGISGRTVQRMVEAGTLKPAHRLPGRNGAHLFTRSYVEALVAERTEAATA